MEDVNRLLEILDNERSFSSLMKMNKYFVNMRNREAHNKMRPNIPVLKTLVAKQQQHQLKGHVATVVTSTEVLKERLLGKETDFKDLTQKYEEVNEKLLVAHPENREFKTKIEEKDGLISFLTNQVAELRFSLESYQVECSRLKSKDNETGSRANEDASPIPLPSVSKKLYLGQ
ncbi:Uncharacterized protein Fot_11164 [Forsythia ovata]|uniref:Uncharacterized protein n=1 Tax=Forsythia ovata TaxID=205694 RepID=A0ABD1WIY0_9LAMI